MIKKLREYGSLLKETYEGFSNDGVFTMAAALAYYTVFSLSPILLIIIAIAGFVMGEGSVQDTVFFQIRDLLGKEAAIQIQDAINRSIDFEQNTMAIIIGMGTLIFGSTTVFVTMQDSLNRIWKVRPKVSSGIWKVLKDRLTSFGMVIGMGFILMVSMAINTTIDFLGNYMHEHLPSLSIYLISIFSYFLSAAISFTIFALIFKVLPDVEIKWKNILVGALATTFLFSIGKIAIGLYIGNSGVVNIFGAAGSLVVLLIWVFYSSVILYLGAEFTYVYTQRYAAKVTPSSFAVQYVQKEFKVNQGGKKTPLTNNK